MTKKLFITTGLALTLALASNGASAEEVSPKVVKTQKAKKVSKKTYNDAYSPKSHLAQAQVTEKKEEVMIFADVAKPTELVATNHVETKKSDDLDIKVKGKVDVQYGGVDQKADFRHPLETSALPQVDQTASDKYGSLPYGTDFYNEHALATNGEIQIAAEKNIGSNKYGAGLTMNANTSPTSGGNTNPASKVFLFVESDAGRFEAGAVDGASHAMSPSADRIAKATGGIDGDFTNWASVGAYSSVTTTNYVLNDIFLASPALPYACQFSKKANKVNYFSKKTNGFQLGLGFTRDTTSQGTTYEALAFKGVGYKNVVEAGLSYEAKMGDNNSLTLSAVGQLGEARSYYVDSTTSVALRSLGAWEVGGKVQMDKITVAASYGDWGKSGTKLSSTATKKANFWTAGAAYDHNALGVSVTYMNTERQGGFAPAAYAYINAQTDAVYDLTSNKYQALSFGAEYQLMPGLTPYAEVTGFEYKSNSADANLKLNKGTVFLGGIKLNF